VILLAGFDHPRGAQALVDSHALDGLLDDAAPIGHVIDFRLDAAEAARWTSGKDEADVNTHLDAAATAVAASVACGPPTRLFPPAGRHEARHVRAGLHLWYKVACASADETRSHLRQFVERNDSTTARLVASIEPEVLARADTTTVASSDDPYLPQQARHYETIRLFEAWSADVRGSADVVVHVIDYGIDLGHEDLQRNIWQNPGEDCAGYPHAMNGLDDDDNGYVDDCFGWDFVLNVNYPLIDGADPHGTHVAGTISADTDNGIGVAGIAGGTPTRPGARLMVGAVFGESSQGGHAEAIVYGADNGAHISQNSWGSRRPGYVNLALLHALDYAVDVRDVVCVFSAGNDNSAAPHYPAAYDKVIAVAATDAAMVRSSYSNYGAWIDVAAPGDDVVSTGVGDTYVSMSGTSMAAPHVAGVLALGFSANPELSGSALRECLMKTAIPIDAHNDAQYAGLLGAGVADAVGIIECARRSTPAPSVTPAPSTACGSCTHVFRLELRTDDYGTETSVLLDHVHPVGFGCAELPSLGISMGDFADANTLYDVTLADSLCAGETYEITVFDQYGDGLCCAQGDGSWRALVDDVVVAEGGTFGYAESVTFTVANDGSAAPSGSPAPSRSPTEAPTTTAAPTVAPTLTPAPTPVPSLTPHPTVAPTAAPSSTFAPSAPCVAACDLTLRLELLTDFWPGETRWAVEQQSRSACPRTPASSGGFAERFTLHDVLIADTLCVGETYVVTLTDAYGDGICCVWGTGYYRVYVDDVLVESGGDFGFAEPIVFTAGRIPTTAPTAVPTAPTSLPTTSFAPSSHPTAPTPDPTATLAPSALCGACGHRLTLEMRTDDWGRETSWSLEHVEPLPNCVYTTGASPPDGYADLTVYEITISEELCAGETYTFTIADSFGDGLCCDWGDGYYRLWLDDTLVAAGGDFADSDSVTFTVEADATPVPTFDTSAPTFDSPAPTVDTWAPASSGWS